MLWKVGLPNLGSSAPVVASDRVFVLSEPGWKHDLPVISCYAVADGKLLWEKQIDHLHLTVPDEAQRQAIRDHWRKHLAWVRDYYLLFHAYTAQPEDPDVKRRMAEMGVLSWGSNYLYGKFDETKVSEYSMGRFGKIFPEVAQALVHLDTWRCMGSHDQMWIGEVFGTPVTDGQALYVATAWGVYASYDLAGNLRWMQVMSPQRPHDYCAVARSPILWRDLFISDLGRMVRAFDRATGQLKWEHKRAGGVHEFVSPVILRVGQQEILWCAGPAAYSLPDGKPLKISGWNNNGMILAVNTDKPDTLFLNGGDEHGGWEGKGRSPHPPPAAVRFSLAGDTLQAKVLWSTVNGNPSVGTVGMLYHDGKLYYAGAKGVILDAESGVVVRGLYGEAVPRANHHMAIAGGHVYGLATDGAMEVFTLDGRRVARNPLRTTPFEQLDPPDQTKRLSQWFSWPKASNRNWEFSYSSPFTVAGDRLYIRSMDHLYCIADKGQAPVPATPAVAPAVSAEAAQQKRAQLVKQMLGSNLHDYTTPLLATQLYDLGPMPRALLQQIEARIDQRMYPINGPKAAQDFVAACYRRDGEVGFTRVWLHPMPWLGGPKRGQEIRLEWVALNATKVTLDPGVGQVPAVGEHKVVLDQPATFTLTAEGPGGPSVRTIEVKLKEDTK